MSERLFIASTRFNEQTLVENRNYREKIYKKDPECNCIYGTGTKLSNNLRTFERVLVVEMNNSLNRIEGIGLIRNAEYDKRCNIYSIDNYNRYIYKGKYFIDRETLMTLDPKLVYILEIVLFKGKSHSKRHSGITLISPDILKHWNVNHWTLKITIWTLFKTHFKKN